MKEMTSLMVGQPATKSAPQDHTCGIDNTKYVLGSKFTDYKNCIEKYVIAIGKGFTME